MAFEREWEVSTPNQAASGHMILRSEGWSGKIISRDAPDLEDRKFQFKIDMTSYSDSYFVGITGELHTTENSYGYVSAGNKCVVGISLEHFGVADLGNNEYRVNMLGLDIENADPSHRNDAVGAWGSQDPFTSVDMTYGYGFSVTNLVGVNAYSGADFTIADGGIGSVGCGNNVEALFHHVLDYGNWARHSETTLETDLPIFETDADLLAWCQDPTNPDTIAKMLNKSEPVDPYEEWLKDQYYYKLKFRYRINNGSPVYGNFRWKPYKKRPICLYWDNSGDYPILRMRGFTTDYLFARADMDAITDDEFDYLTPDQAVINAIESIPYIKKSGRYKVLGGYDNLTVDLWDCNLPIYGSLQDAQDYEDDLLDFEDAENYQDIIRDEQVNIPPDFGELDTEGDNGLNDLFLDLGARMYILSESQLRTLFAEINDSDVADDIMKDFGKLFGGNAIQCLTSLMYFPFNVSDVCTPGTSEHIKIGGYTCTDALGQPINKNNKRIDCGSQFLPPVFNDFRDFEPYQMLYILLPYSGIHPLALSKYLGKTLSIQFACDVCTGAGCFYIYADGILYDSFVANVGQSRPITATDQSRYLQSVVDAVSNVASIPINNFQSKVNVATDALTGNIAGAASGVADYAVDSLTTAPRMGYALINAKHIIDDPPMQNFGGAGAGNVSAFGNQYIHLIVAQKNGTKATNALELVGAPSNAGGAVGSFSGYLQCKAFNLGRGLTATEQEANEIVSLMQGGVYI